MNWALSGAPSTAGSRPGSSRLALASDEGFWTPTVFMRMNLVGLVGRFSSMASHKRRVAPECDCLSETDSGVGAS